MTEYFKDGELKSTYTYNAFGQRIKKTIRRAKNSDDDHKSLTFTYLPSGWLLSEDGRDDANNKGWTRDYIWLGGKPIAQIKSKFKADGSVKDQEVSYIHTDHLNTPRVATNQDQEVVWRWDSDAFGEQKAQRDADNNGKKTKISLRFPGQYFDSESKLHYNHYRDYDPKIGRYIQSDPRGVLLDFSDPQRRLAAQAGIGIVDQRGYGLNHLYGYVYQNPLAFYDSTGECGVVGAAIGFVGGFFGGLIFASIDAFTNTGASGVDQAIDFGQITLTTALGGAAIGSCVGVGAGIGLLVGTTGANLGIDAAQRSGCR